jgi:hypothetical protein
VGKGFYRKKKEDSGTMLGRLPVELSLPNPGHVSLFTPSGRNITMDIDILGLVANIIFL